MVVALKSRQTKYRKTATWLAARSKLVGASDSPALLGVGYSNESPYTVWAKKRGLLPETDGTEAMDWGRWLQPTIISKFGEIAGLEVQDMGEFTIQQHPEFPFIGCTLDGLCDDAECGLAVVECKNVGQYSAGDWQNDEPPLRVQVQVQHQMLATGLDAAYVVGLVGGNKLEWRRVVRNDEFIDGLISELTAFWQLVQEGIPPPVDGSAATRDAIRRLHPKDKGFIVDLPTEATEWHQQFEEAKAAKKLAEQIEGQVGNLLRAAIGDATYGRLPDGGCYSWKHSDRAGYTVEPSQTRILKYSKKEPE